MSTIPISVDDLLALREAITSANSGPTPLVPLEEVPRLATMFITQLNPEDTHHDHDSNPHP